MENKPELPAAPLYLIPSRIAETEPLEVLPLSVKKVVDSIDHYIVENEKTSREFIRKVLSGKSQPSLHIRIHNQYTPTEELPELLSPCLNGNPTGVISDSGMPVIGDSGHELIRMAHELGIRVIPMVGPSAIVMALMASGLSGHSFAYVGYLPPEDGLRKRRISALEKKAQKGETQIFVETPLQNNQLFEEIVAVCEPHTLLSVASDITAPSETIRTKSIEDWKKEAPVLDKRPTVFLLGK